MGKWTSIQEDTAIAAFLNGKEPESVSAYAKFLEKTERKTWVLRKKSAVVGVIVISGGAFYPVFGDWEKSDRENISPFFEKALLKKPLRAIQGAAKDVELLEQYMAEYGFFPSERTLYDFMSLDRFPPENTDFAGPAGLILRQPGASDMDALFQLQSAYEREEVLLKTAAFNPSLCRMILEHIISHEQIMVAEFQGALVGKINTSASTPDMFRIGGVYVLPAYRKQGIATKMTALFTRSLLDAGKRLVGLFVKKSNAQALAVYSRVGFETLADYRISYF